MSSLKENLIKNPPTHPRDVRLDLPKSEIQSNTMNNALPAYLKPKKNRWWKTVILLVFLFSLLSAIGVLLWKMAIV
jgi:hypothetical protein